MTDMEYFLDKVNYIIELVPETDKIITVGKNYFYASVRLKHFNKPKDVERDQFRYVDRVVIACGELPREHKSEVKEMMNTDRVYSHIYYISLYQTDGFTCMERPICGISLKFDNDERIREIIRQNSPGNTEPLFMRSCEFTTFNSYFNLTGPPQDNIMYFYDVSLYTPISDHFSPYEYLFSTWESYDKNKHRNDFQVIFTKYADIINNDTKYLRPHSKEYFEFDAHIYEDRFLVIDEKSRYDGEPLQVYEDLKIMFAGDKTFIRIIINKTGNGLRHWFVYSMELSFNTDGTFVAAEEYQSPTVLETLRPPHDFISWIHEYIRNIGESIDSKYKKD